MTRWAAAGVVTKYIVHRETMATNFEMTLTDMGLSLAGGLSPASQLTRFIDVYG
jgi:hypothetical protein